MDAKEVELRGKALTKAISGGEPSASLVKLLNDLKDGMKATEDILRQTKIGVTVNRLRTHKDPAVQKLAQELVNKWKDQVNKSKKQSGPTKASTPSNAQSTASPMPPSATASPVPIRKKHNVDPAKRTYKSDKVNTDITGNQARDAFVGLIYNGLAFMSDERKYNVIYCWQTFLTCCF
jgi:transcription elongation factor S-II